MVGNNM